MKRWRISSNGFSIQKKKERERDFVGMNAMSEIKNSMYRLNSIQT